MVTYELVILFVFTFYKKCAILYSSGDKPDILYLNYFERRNRVPTLHLAKTIKSKNQKPNNNQLDNNEYQRMFTDLRRVLNELKRAMESDK